MMTPEKARALGRLLGRALDFLQGKYELANIDRVLVLLAAAWGEAGKNHLDAEKLSALAVQFWHDQAELERRAQVPRTG